MNHTRIPQTGLCVSFHNCPRRQAGSQGQSVKVWSIITNTEIKSSLVKHHSVMTGWFFYYHTRWQSRNSWWKIQLGNGGFCFRMAGLTDRCPLPAIRKWATVHLTWSLCTEMPTNATLRHLSGNRARTRAKLMILLKSIIPTTGYSKYITIHFGKEGVSF